jgi:hypothetical protein
MGGFRQTQEYNNQLSFAQVLAATATTKFPIFTAPCKCRITAVSFMPQTGSTGDNTNTKNLNLINGGAAGAGTTEVGNLDLVTGTDLTALDEKAIPFNATYSGGVVLNEGDVLILEVEKVGTGVNAGPGIVNVDYVPA